MSGVDYLTSEVGTSAQRSKGSWVARVAEVARVVRVAGVAGLARLQEWTT